MVTLVATGLALAGSAVARGTPTTHIWNQSVCLIVAGGMVLLLDAASGPRPGAVTAGSTTTVPAEMAQMTGHLPPTGTGAHVSSVWTASLLLGGLLLVGWRIIVRRRAGRSERDPAPRRLLVRLHDAAMFSCLALMAVMPAVSM